MKEEWKDKLRESMDGFEETAPDGLWSAVNEALKSNTCAAPVGGKALKAAPLRVSHTRLFVRVAAVAACVAGGVGLYLHLRNAEADSAELSLAHKAPTAAADEGALPESSAQPLLAEADTKPHGGGIATPVTPYIIYSGEDTSANGTGDMDSQTAVEAVPTEQGAPAPYASADAQTEGNAVDGIAVASTAAGEETPAVMSKMVHTRGVPLLQNAGQAVAATRTAAVSNRFSASTYAMGNMSSSVSDNGGMLLMSGSFSSAQFDSDPAGDEESVCSAPKKYLVPSGPGQSVKHHQPVRMGVSLRYALTQRWGLSAGLVYTRLSSDMVQDGVADRYVSSQKLQFLGVPLIVDYSVWRSRWLTFYASAGMMAEKCVAGKLRTEYVVSDRTVSVTESNIDIDRLQWSVNAAIGLQFNIVRQVGIYFEPGVDWHFGNGGSVKTIYTDKPLEPTLKFGLRYTIGE